LVVLLLLLLFLPSARIERSQYPRSSRAVGQFVNCWWLTWVFWLALYTLFAVKALLSVWRSPVQTLAMPITAILENLLSNLPALAIVLCYIVLAAPHSQDRSEPPPLPWARWLAVVLALTVLEIILTVVPATSGSAHVVFRWISAFGSGVAMALLVGRFDSKLIDPPQWLIFLFYVYAVIQAGFAEFPEHPNLAVVLINVALIIKLLLYGFVFWLFDSGVLLFYFERARTMDKYVPGEREQFVRGLAA